MDETDGTRSKANAAVRCISHPVTGFVVGIAGIILAIYFYFKSETEPKLTILMHPVRTSIVQAGRVSELSVSLHGRPVTSDLTAAQFVIWNAGRVAISHDDILKAVVLATMSNAPIFEATVRSVSRPDIIDFQMVTNNIAIGHLGFDWKILEHNDGASIQVIYGGNSKLVFTEQGVLKGQSSIPFRYADTQTTTPGFIAKEIISSLGALVFFAGALTSFKDARKRIRERKRVAVIGNIIGLAFFLLLAAGLSYDVISPVFQDKPPAFAFN